MPLGSIAGLILAAEWIKSRLPLKPQHAAGREKTGREFGAVLGMQHSEHPKGSWRVRGIGSATFVSWNHHISLNISAHPGCTVNPSAPSFGFCARDGSCSWQEGPGEVDLAAATPQSSHTIPWVGMAPSPQKGAFRTSWPCPKNLSVEGLLQAIFFFPFFNERKGFQKGTELGC